MHEPEFFNDTAFVASPFPMIDAEGYESRVVVVKASYKLAATEELVDESRPIRGGDEMWGSPEIADVRYPGDLCCFKPGTDIVLVGTVETERWTRTSFVELDFRIATVRKRLRVFGERYWDTWGPGFGITPASPVERVPLAWSRAWGGYDWSDAGSPVEEPRNPVGRGVARHPKELAGKPAPQIEDAAAPISRPDRRNIPAGVAPLGRHFEPRRTWAGTHDEEWLQNVYPAKPANYDPRHENVAPADLVLGSPLRGGETMEITGLKPGPPLRFAVPGVRLVIEAVIDGRTIEHRPHIDTLLIDADANIVEIVWRTAFRCPLKMRKRFAEIEVSSKELI